MVKKGSSSRKCFIIFPSLYIIRCNLRSSLLLLHLIACHSRSSSTCSNFPWLVCALSSFVQSNSLYNVYLRSCGIFYLYRFISFHRQAGLQKQSASRFRELLNEWLGELLHDQSTLEGQGKISLYRCLFAGGLQMYHSAKPKKILYTISILKHMFANDCKRRCLHTLWLFIIRPACPKCSTFSGQSLSSESSP